jgi:hypothetical protein
LAISAANTNNRLIVKMIILSFTVWLTKVVEVVIQKRKMAGFNVFIKKPERKIFA